MHHRFDLVDFRTLPYRPLPVHMFYLHLLFLIALLIGGCNTDFPEEKILREMMVERRERLSQMDALHKQVDSIWASTTEMLAVSLPVDMPADERRNMLQVRNAELIQMFEVFDSLDLDLKMLVKDSGMKDRTIAEEMRKVMTEIDVLDSIINSNLEILNRKDSLRAQAIQAKAE